MSLRQRSFLAIGGAALVATSARAQGKLPPVRPLPAAERTSSEAFSAVSSARALSDGRVLINDIVGRRVVLFDQALTNYTVVADTTSATANAYSSRTGGLIPYRGDSTLFVDPSSMSMLVIDPSGKLGRVMSIPSANDASSLIGGNSGFPGFDAQGRLIYRANALTRIGGPPAASNGSARGGQPSITTGSGQQIVMGGPGGANNGSGGAPAFNMPTFPDSVPLVRMEIATRKLDTLAMLKTYRPKMSMLRDSSSGNISVSSIINPLPQVDDYAVLADGSIAVIRGQEYRVEWIRPNGERVAGSKLPFDWRKLDEAAKVAFLDSTKTAMEKVRQAGNARAQNGGAPLPLNAGGSPAGASGGGSMVMTFSRAEGGASSDAPRPRDQGAGPGGFNMSIPPLQFVSPSELPDYAPPFAAGSARGDFDGNLWIRTTNTVNGGSVYDVVTPKGELLDRVAVPVGRVVAGFGPKGAVYLGYRDEKGVVRLERSRWVPPTM